MCCIFLKHVRENNGNNQERRLTGIVKEREEILECLLMFLK